MCACHPPARTRTLYQKEMMFLGMGICISPPVHGNPTPTPTMPQQCAFHRSFGPDLIPTEEGPSPRAKESSSTPPPHRPHPPPELGLGLTGRQQPWRPLEAVCPPLTWDRPSMRGHIQPRHAHEASILATHPQYRSQGQENQAFTA